jgi:acetyltransferase-like isoleucine patch superfamily enzyme
MSIIGHDVFIGENSVISSMVNMGGACIVGSDSYVGMGALIKEGVKIGSNSIVGMGSVVYNDIPDGVIALGNPARVMRNNENQKVFK